MQWIAITGLESTIKLELRLARVQILASYLDFITGLESTIKLELRLARVQILAYHFFLLITYRMSLRNCFLYYQRHDSKFKMLANINFTSKQIYKTRFHEEKDMCNTSEECHRRCILKKFRVSLL